MSVMVFLSESIEIPVILLIWWLLHGINRFINGMIVLNGIPQDRERVEATSGRFPRSSS